MNPKTEAEAGGTVLPVYLPGWIEAGGQPRAAQQKTAIVMTATLK
ncbi:MAG: hypothetical protein N2689_16500 [Verrucomicrobiae bacterium]|nr:hypothetical protein [Verrucomicrobiae bacterium]